MTDIALLNDTVAAIQQVGGDLFYRINSPTELGDILVQMRRVVNVAGWGLVAVLGIVSVVIISNTIRLTVFARRKEINIMKFVGATNAFIRMPFFVEGMTVGALAGLISTVLVGGAYFAALKALAQPGAMWLDEFTQCLYPFHVVILPLAGIFILFGMFIGSAGCAFSIRKLLSSANTSDATDQLLSLMSKTNTNRDFTTRMRDWMNLYERQGYTFGSQVGGRFEKN